MSTYFVRHTRQLDIDDATRGSLWDQRRIAIHFPNAEVGDEWPTVDSTSLEPDDYPMNGKKALRALRALAQFGGYVYAEHFPRKEALVGYVEPDSQIELLRGTWRSQSGRTAVLKSLRLVRAQVLAPSQTVVVNVTRPQQGTLMKWPSVGNAIENIVEGRSGECSLRSLTPTCQEIMCSEYLRTKDAAALGLPRLSRLLLLGRTMRDIDIVGLADDGSRILAQVTYRSLHDSDSKIRELEKYAAEGCHRIFFCQCPVPEMRQSIHVVPLDLVYSAFTLDRIGRQWLKMVGGGT